MKIRFAMPGAIILAIISPTSYALINGGPCTSTTYPGGTVNLGLVPAGSTSITGCYPASGSVRAGCATINISGTPNGTFTALARVPNPLPPSPPGCNQPGTMAVTFTGVLGDQGWITPKYLVVGVTYAPPGSKSTATYSSGFNMGTATTNTSSFKQGVTVSYKVNGGFDLFGILDGNVTNTASAGLEQTTGSSNSIALSQSFTNGLTVPGPASSGLGVDHDFDTVYVWLNPAVQLFVSGSNVTNQGYNWDARDTITGPDVIPLTIGELRGVQPFTDPNVQTRLNRNWDGNLGAITATDMLAIAQADPFYSNPSFNPNTDTSHRYDLPDGTDLILNYVPAPAGGQPTAQNYTSTYTSTSTAGQSASTMYTVSYAEEGNASFKFIADLSGTLTVTGSYSYTNGWSSTLTNGTSQTANFTIVPPLASDNYTGPTAVQVWKDNVYGTFMFFPQN